METPVVIPLESIIISLAQMIDDLNHRKGTRRDNAARHIAVAITEIENAHLRLLHAYERYEER